MTWQPMEDAPKNRTIIARMRDGREMRVSWDKRSGPPKNSYLGTTEPGMVEGWCSREDERRIIPAPNLVRWREIAEEE